MPEVVIIGAGVVGTSIAFHLAKLGCRDVVVLEKNYISSGSTEKCAGGIRQQFSTESNIRLSMESVRFFQHFEEHTGHVADFRQYGYLILATAEDELTIFRHNVDLQGRLGVKVDLLDPGEVTELVPGLNIDGVLGATYCHDDGYADPYSVVSGFASAAKAMGVKILEETEVTGIELLNNQVQAVLTTRGKIETPVVVNAAGAYAGIIGNMVGIDIPIRPSRRHVFITEPVFRRSSKMAGLNRADLPMVIDFHNGFWFRREGLCLIFGMRNPDEPQGFDISVDWGFLTDILAPLACQRLPSLIDIGITRAQAGLHADTPDKMAILGETPQVNGFYLACGFSGHGFMHSPAVGRLMAKLVLRENTSSFSNIDSFSIERFKNAVSSEESSFI